MRSKSEIKNGKKPQRAKENKRSLSKKNDTFSVPITPLMTRRYSASDRRRLREYEQQLIKMMEEK